MAKSSVLSGLLNSEGRVSFPAALNHAKSASGLPLSLQNCSKAVCHVSGLTFVCFRVSLEAARVPVTKTEKSKTKRPFRECTFLVYFDYGIDDIGTSLDFLFDLRGKDGKLVKAAEKIEWDGKEYRRQALILEIENSKAYKQALDRQVIERWEELENAVASNRRPKYA